MAVGMEKRNRKKRFIISVFQNGLYDNGTPHTQNTILLNISLKTDLSMRVIVVSILKAIRMTETDELQTF